MSIVTAHRLAYADRQIVEGIALVIKQRQVILEMEQIGLDAGKSNDALSNFLNTLRKFVDYRDKLLRELDGAAS
jgi:hypothetical protein